MDGREDEVGGDAIGVRRLDRGVTSAVIHRKMAAPFARDRVNVVIVKLQCAQDDLDVVGNRDGAACGDRVGELRFVALAVRKTLSRIAGDEHPVRGRVPSAAAGDVPAEDAGGSDALFEWLRKRRKFGGDSFGFGLLGVVHAPFLPESAKVWYQPK